MKVKNKKLEWYCICWNLNNSEPTTINIMNYINLEDLKKKIKYKRNQTHTME